MDGVRFEHEPDAAIFAEYGLSRVWPCTPQPDGANELFTVDGSDYGPYPARPASPVWGPHEPISVTGEVAARIADHLNTLNAGCGLTVTWDGGSGLIFTWDKTYRDDEGTETVTPDAEGRYPIGGLWPWMRWSDRG
ncbi:hypothetical protein [Streptomyces sp. NPDC088785]|uniref:hypothetical protein n=1 Tax=Streptomyces sp. NPDC088785 TaxID=3365897 RepID=UPI00381135EA